jgi:hypothetical protein
MEAPFIRSRICDPCGRDHALRHSPDLPSSLDSTGFRGQQFPSGAGRQPAKAQRREVEFRQMLQRKITVIAAILLGVLLWSQRERVPSAPPSSQSAGYPAARQPAAQQKFSERDDGKMILVSGVVDRTMSDDREGSQHQRFILRLASGQTLLVAHNIDLAPRVDGLARGEALTLAGQFEWNDRGGVVHWTHRDPRGVHPAGYIERQGRRYE